MKTENKCRDMKNKRLKRRLLDILILLITIAAIFCLMMAVFAYSEYKEGNDAYIGAAGSFLSSDTEKTAETETADTVRETEESAVPVAPEETAAKETAAPEGSEITPLRETAAPAKPIASGKITVDFAALKAVNKDIVAWIISDGTLISYPVAACDSEEDYDFYISHLFDGRKNKLGTLFCDARNEPFEENNTIIYGHNMLNGTMFSGLLNYRKQSWYESHPEMRLYTPGGRFKIKLFSGYMTADKSDAYVLNLTGDAFAEYIRKAVGNSDFKARFTPSASDKLITLSTCDNRTNNKRYVIHGVLTEDT